MNDFTMFTSIINIVDLFSNITIINLKINNINSF